MFVLAFCIIVIPAMLVLFIQSLAHVHSGDRSIAWYSYGQPVNYITLLVFSGVFLALAVIGIFRIVVSKPENHKPDDADGPSS